MATFESLTNQVKTGLSRVPSYLTIDATYTLNYGSGGYDPVTDADTTSNVITKPLVLIKGPSTDVSIRTSTALSESTPDLGKTFICEHRYFDDIQPDVKGTITIGVEDYIITRITTDAVGLTHTFLLEKKNAFSG